MSVIESGSHPKTLYSQEGPPTEFITRGKKSVIRGPVRRRKVSSSFPIANRDFLLHEFKEKVFCDIAFYFFVLIYMRLYLFLALLLEKRINMQQ